MSNPWSAHSTEIKKGSGVLQAIAWPPPRARSLLHYEPTSGRALIAEVDIEAVRNARNADPEAQRFASAVAPEAGAWIFHWDSGSQHLVTLPLSTMQLAVSQLSADSKMQLRLLLPVGGRSRPREHLVLSAHLEPLAGDKLTSHACLSEDAMGRLLLIRYDVESGSASFHRLQPRRNCSGSQEPVWDITTLGSAFLTPRREVTRVLPLRGNSADQVGILQYDVQRGSVSVCKYLLTPTARPVVLQTSDSHWLPHYPNSHIVPVMEHCCLVEYDPVRSYLNIGRFDENGRYQAPYGDWWRCILPKCAILMGVWPANDSDEHGPVALFNLAAGGLALCGLPRNPGNADPITAHDSRASSQWWFASFDSPMEEELLQAVREENWKHRQAALLLSQAPVGSKGTMNLVQLLRELRCKEEGLLRSLVSML